MQFEYTMTLEDLREATAAQSPVNRQATPLRSLYTWLPIFFVCVLFALPGRLSGGYSASVMWQPPGVPIQNLWVTLAPSLCVTTFLTTPTILRIWNAYRSRQKKQAGKAINPNTVLSSVLFYLSMIWIIPVVYPGLAIEWAPTPGQALWAAFSPWPLWFAMVGYSSTRRKNRALAATWAKKPSFHRPSRIEVTANGVSIDDGVIASQIKWSHYKRYAETSNLLLLINENDTTTFIAKRAVATGPAMDELRMLISENIKDGSFKKTATAFPVVMPVVALADGQ